MVAYFRSDTSCRSRFERDKNGLKSRLRLKISLSSPKMAGFAPHSTGWPTENRHAEICPEIPHHGLVQSYQECSAYEPTEMVI
jgi:hypothetical protein